MPYGRLRSVMTPLDMAWSVLKSNPNFQAFEAGGYHPEGNLLPLTAAPRIRNLGTVDPAVMAMGLRQVAGGNPQETVSRLMDGNMHVFGLPLQAQGDPYQSDDGFEGMGEGSSDYFGVSRQPRPVAETRRPRARSPQHIIDVFKPKGNPMTPEDDAELAALLRQNDKHMRRRSHPSLGGP